MRFREPVTFERRSASRDTRRAGTPVRIPRSGAWSVAVLALAAATPTGCAGTVGDGAELQALQLDDRIQVTLGDQVVTEYRYAPGQKYPYFYPVNGPLSGESVTTESSEPYPHHHSLFFGLDFVNGGNYWQEGLERGQIVPQTTRLIRAAGPDIVFQQTSLWLRPDAEAPFRDHRTIRVSAPSEDVRVIDVDITLTSLIDVRVERSNHSLFAARMVPALSVDSGGTLVNAHGDRDAEATFGRAAEWADFWGTRGDLTEGLAILNHPDNPWTPPQWFTRDYGFFSPTPFNWLESGVFELPRGERLRLRYRVVVHAGTTRDAGIAELYTAYAAAR